jgi:hypothetical protein
LGFILANLRLIELIAIVNKNKPFYDDFIYANLFTRDIHKAIAVAEADGYK